MTIYRVVARLCPTNRPNLPVDGTECKQIMQKNEGFTPPRPASMGGSLPCQRQMVLGPSLSSYCCPCAEIKVGAPRQCYAPAGAFPGAVSQGLDEDSVVVLGNVSYSPAKRPLLARCGPGYLARAFEDHLRKLAIRPHAVDVQCSYLLKCVWQIDRRNSLALHQRKTWGN